MVVVHGVYIQQRFVRYVRTRLRKLYPSKFRNVSVF